MFCQSWGCSGKATEVVRIGGNDLKSVQNQLKRNHVISELKKFSVFEIDGRDLSTVKYSVLLKKLAVMRASKEG